MIVKKRGKEDTRTASCYHKVPCNLGLISLNVTFLVPLSSLTFFLNYERVYLLIF